jgi:hypothetical protein
MSPGEIREQVLYNCEVSNAQHWGVYSICGLLIRLIDLYKWETGAKPYARIDHSVLMDWVSEKERRWAELQGEFLRDLRIDGQTYGPFDAAGINQVLKSRGMLYGAGLVASLRPSFFLAELEDSWEVEGFRVHLLGREHARDLVAGPALSQGNSIFLRRDTLERFLWGKLEEYKSSKSPNLGFAFRAYGLEEERLLGDPASLESDIKKIAEEELMTYLHHELGEARDTLLPEEEWHGILSSFSPSAVEHFARGIKDLLADTSPGGMLDHIIRERKEGSLGFYMALHTGYRKVVFPEVTEAFQKFQEGGDWALMESARERGYRRAGDLAEKLLDIHEKGRDRGRKWVEQEVNRIVASLSRP